MGHVVCKTAANKRPIVCMWPVHVTRGSVTWHLQPKQKRDRRRNRGTKCIMWTKSPSVSGRDRPSRFQITNPSVKCSSSCRKILGKKKIYIYYIYSSHNHNLLDNCSSCSGTDKVQWLEFRKNCFDSVLCGLTLDGCDAVLSEGSVCEEVMSVLYIVLYNPLWHHKGKREKC